MRLISAQECTRLLAEQPIQKHMKFFDDQVFSGLGTVWYFNWLSGLRDYLVSREGRVNRTPAAAAGHQELEGQMGE